MLPTELQAILFDFGGVLVEWDGVQPLLDLTEGRLWADEARLFWLSSPAVRNFEAGRCAKEEFAEEAIEELQADLRQAISSPSSLPGIGSAAGRSGTRGRSEGTNHGLAVARPPANCKGRVPASG